MDKNQKTIGLLAIVAYLLVAVSFFVSIQYSFIALIGLLIFTIILAKNDEDTKSIAPVSGAVLLFFGVKVVDLVFTVLNRIIDRIQEWRLESLEERAKETESAEKLEELGEKYESLLERMEANLFQEICDVVLFIVTLGVIALCVLAIINLLSGKEFRTSIVGKIVEPVFKDKVPPVTCPNCGKVIKGEFCANCGTKRSE